MSCTGVRMMRILAGFAGSLLAAAAMAATVPAAITPDARITFGILPIGGPAESLEAWKPMLTDMQSALHHPVRSISVSTYDGLAQALTERRVDVAFLSGQMALNAVLHQDMQVVAQLTRTDGSLGYYAVLVVQHGGAVKNLDDVFAHPNHWRYARGESLSVSGYLVPETQLFAPRGLDSDTFFRSVRVDSHENCALAVANGEVDVASNNTADLERFQKHFPLQYSHLQIIWRSSLIPHAVIVVRRDLPAALRAQIADFLTGYAKAPGREGDRQRANLLLIHEISGFAPAHNATLVPFANIDYTLERRRALSSQWVSEKAREVRLGQIEARHKAAVEMLDHAMPLATH